MSTTFYSATIEPMQATLTNLRGVLAKGKAYADEQGIDEQEFLSRKLIDDMLDLRTQVIVLYMLSLQKGAFLVTDVEASKLNPNPKSFAELDQNIELMLKDLASIDAQEYQAAEQRKLSCEIPNAVMHFDSAYQLMLRWAIPHMYFHATTAYDILRHNGVPLTKADYIGNIGVRPQPLES